MSDDKIKGSFAALTDVFATIDKALSEHEHIILAIDGNSGSGKSCLADLLAARYDCNVIHMDDFFLQPHQRTSERLKEPGGNIDYERFFGQVMSRLKTREEFQYQRYDCGKQELVGWITLTPKKLNIIEGVYSMHPLWNKLLDIRIFNPSAADTGRTHQAAKRRRDVEKVPAGMDTHGESLFRNLWNSEALRSDY